MRRIVTASILSSAIVALGALVLGAAFSRLGVHPVEAADTVVCPADDLQAAINNATPGGTLHVTGTCVGNFTIEKDLRLEGEHAATLHGAGGTVVTIGDGARVKLSDLAVTGGTAVAVGYAAEGGGIYNAGILTLDGTSSVTDSVAAGAFGYGGTGGGIFNSGTLTLNGTSTVSGNDTGGSGGGVFNAGKLTLNDRSSVSGNTGGSSGGIYNAGTLTLNDKSSVADNRALHPRGGAGGGIWNEGTLMLNDRSAVYGNTALQPGGGILNRGTVTLNDRSQVRGNTAYAGGGIANSGMVILNNHSQVLGNTAQSSGGGIINSSAGVVIGANGRVYDNVPDQCAYC